MYTPPRPTTHSIPRPGIRLSGALTAGLALAAGVTAAAAVLLHEPLHLLALLRGEHGLRVAHRGLPVPLQLLLHRLHLLPEAPHRLALLVGEPGALALRTAVLAATAALHPLSTLTALGAEVGKAGLPARRLHALHQRRVLRLEALVDGLQARNLGVGEAELLAVAQEAALPRALLLVPPAAMVGAALRRSLLRDEQHGRAGERQRKRERTNLHR
jgi:hypothetical protein